MKPLDIHIIDLVQDDNRIINFDIIIIIVIFYRYHIPALPRFLIVTPAVYYYYYYYLTYSRSFMSCRQNYG